MFGSFAFQRIPLGSDIGVIYDAEAAEATIRILLAHGADVRSTSVYLPLEVPRSWRGPEAPGSRGQPDVLAHRRNTANYVAARNAETAAVEMLLDYGAEIDVTDSNNGNATMEAAKAGYLATLRPLVDRGTNLNFDDDYKNTALTYAFMYHEKAVTVSRGL